MMLEKQSGHRRVSIIDNLLIELIKIQPLFRQPKTVSFIESADKWQDSRFRLPSRGDLIVISGGAISTFKASPVADKLHAWKDIWYPEGTYFIVLEVVPHRTIIPSEKGAMWHVVHGSRDYLLNTRFVRWKLVK